MRALHTAHEESVPYGDGFTRDDVFARPQPANRPVKVFFGNDGDRKFSKHADDLGPKGSELSEYLPVDEFAIVILGIHLAPIQAEDVRLNVWLRLAAVLG